MRLLQKLNEAGLHLAADGDRLIVSPKAAITDEIRQAIRQHKSELLELLRCGPEYTMADLAEMDRLLHELARLESWTGAELADKLDQRGRMAPVNVIAALHLLRDAVATAKPGKRARVALCVIQGGKGGA